MSVVIWIKIHHHKSVLPTIKDQHLTVISRFRFITEDAPVLFHSADVFHSPRCPESIHVKCKMGDGIWKNNKRKEC